MTTKNLSRTTVISITKKDASSIFYPLQSLIKRGFIQVPSKED